jgi:hypothetical protein
MENRGGDSSKQNTSDIHSISNISNTKNDNDGLPFLKIVYCADMLHSLMEPLQIINK